MAAVFSEPIICPLLIGRDDAVERLRQVHDAAVRGSGQVVLVSGEAGIGKSRLVETVAEQAAGDGWRFLLGHFFEQDKNLPYSAIIDVLTQVRSKGNGELEPFLAPVAGDLALLEPRTARLAGAAADQEPDGDAEQTKRRILDALVSLVRAMSQDRPTLLVFEDLHWGDDSSFEAILHIARARIPRSLLLLTYRSDEVHPPLRAFQAELDRGRLAAEVGLNRLTAGQVDRMLRAILSAETSMRADFLHTIYQLTDGNPFFVEEVLRAVLDQAGSFAALDSLQSKDLNVPRSVNEAVRRRTARLSTEAGEVLAIAAVAGPRFDFPLLQELCDKDEAELLRLIKELIAAQLVTELAEDVFAFRHALTREAICSDMLLRERRALSRRIAEAIERLHADDLDSVIEDLAWHFYEAGEWAKALDYLRRAGERALAVYSPAAALEHVTRALEAAGHVGGSAMAPLYLLRASAHEGLGNFDQARNDYERAAAEAEAASDSRTRWQALVDLGLLWASRDYSRSEPYFNEALELARELGDPATLAHSLNRLGNWYTNRGQFERGLHLSEEALAISRAAGDRREVAQTLDLLGITCSMGMQMALAKKYYLEAISLLEEIGDRRTLASALSSIQLGASTYQTDMVPPALTLSEASEFGERAVEIARQSGSRSAESYTLWQLTFCLGPHGEYERALLYGREALAIAREIGHTQWETGASCALGALFSDMLAPEKAQEYLTHAVELSHSMSSEIWLGQAAALLIEAFLLNNDIDRAVEVFEAMPTGDLEDPFSWGRLHYDAVAAGIALALGEYQRTLDIVSSLESIAERSVPGGTSLRDARLRGLAEIGLSKQAEGLLSLRRALRTAESSSNRSYQRLLLTDLARAHMAIGDREAARGAAARAVGVLDDLASRIRDEPLKASFLTRAMDYLPASLRRRPARDHIDGLTAREAEIAALVAHGMTNREIADELVVSARTVETHVANAMAKMGFANRSQLAAWAVERGLTAG